jgi:dual specificity MAP kinase phosphatase
VCYNVFVLQATPEDMIRELGYALTRTDTGAPHTDGHDAHVHGGPHRANTVNFAQREKDEMRDLTRASEILTVGDDGPRAGRAFLGNHNDVPLAAPGEPAATPFLPGINDPAKGFGYDVCIECHDRAPVPTAAHLRAAEEHLAALNTAWACTGEPGERPPPAPGAIIHFPFPSSPGALGTVLPMLEFLQRVLEPTPAPAPPTDAAPAFVLWPRRRAGSTAPPPRAAGRGARVLIWSSDGYTESSVLALGLLMAVRGLALAEAYLELQVARRRSFFVYHTDLAILRRVDARLAQGRAPANGNAAHSRAPSYDFAMLTGTGRQGPGPVAIHRAPSHAHSNTLPASLPASYPFGAPLPPAGVVGVGRRPRASTSPMLPALVHDHQLWFDDPRFDGSFPSRVLPFLYLGNLCVVLFLFFWRGVAGKAQAESIGRNRNHASNAYMLHALGITHVVSVGECALVPPPEPHGNAPADAGHEAAAGAYGAHGHGHGAHGPGRGAQQGSLWIEEREGRIKVLDIKGVCDDGIDTLEPQLAPICEWIERARREGGQVLVHCRVGVSRSATVTVRALCFFVVLLWCY